MSLAARRDDPTPPDRAALPREELLDSYAHPYRRWLPLALKQRGAYRYLATNAALGVLWAIGMLSDEPGLQVFAATFLVITLIVTAVVLTHALSDGVAAISRRTAEWRPGDGDLARARRNRPQHAEAAPDVAHDEYAVVVADDGRLVTFLYTPLMSGERPARSAVLITGTPRYEAVEVRTDHFDHDDASLAAEQLAAAQEHAAHLEDSAIERARTEVEEREAAYERALETRSTAAALRRITGQ